MLEKSENNSKRTAKLRGKMSAVNRDSDGGNCFGMFLKSPLRGVPYKQTADFLISLHKMKKIQRELFSKKIFLRKDTAGYNILIEVKKNHDM